MLKIYGSELVAVAYSECVSVDGQILTQIKLFPTDCVALIIFRESMTSYKFSL